MEGNNVRFLLFLQKQQSRTTSEDAGQELKTARFDNKEKATHPTLSPAPTLPLACSDRSSVTMLIGFMPAFSARVYGMTSSAEEVKRQGRARQQKRKGRQRRDVRK